MAYTGGKYASTTITTVGTTTVTASGAAFVSTDFASQRIVGLWNSGGTTFLGMAYVRSWVSATQLQLETTFFDPATGATITQATGQIILVSKNFADISGTGVTVTAPNQATFTAAPVFGTAGTSTGVCFYDEGYEIVCPYSIELLGGLTVLGHINSPTQAIIGSNTYTSGAISGPCNIDYGTLAGSSNGIYTGDATSNFAMYGGTLNGQNSPYYNGGYLGTAGYTFIFNNLQSPFDLISPGAGGTWGTNALRMQLVNCISISTATNAICRRWGDGLQVGGVFKFPNNTTAPLSALGSDTNGTYSFAAPSGQRAYVLDFGGNSTGTSSTGAPILVRTNHTGNAITFNITNLVASNYYSGYGGSPAAANPSGINNVYFQDTFSNLVSTTVGVIQLSGTAVASSAATGTSWSPSLLYETVTGFTTTTGPNTSWSYGLKCYGYQVVSGTIAATTYSFGTAGSGPNVSWQTSINQLSDISLVSTGITQSTANGYTSITTLNQLYAASVNWATLSVANSQIPNLTQYPITYSGTQLNLGSYNLTLVQGTTSAGSAFAISGSTITVYVGSGLGVGSVFTSFTSSGTVTVPSGVTVTTPFTTTGTVTNSGTINAQYTSSAGTSGVLTLNNLVAGSSIYIVPNNSQATQYTASSSTTQTYYILPNSGATSGTWKVTQYGYLPVTGSFTSNSTSSVTVSQNIDTGITESQTTAAGLTTLSSPDQIYDYAAYWETTSTGIPFTRVTTKSGSQLSFGSTNVTLNTGAASIYAITSGNPVIKSASSFTPGSTYNSFVTSGSVTLTGITYGSTMTCPYTSSAGSSTVFTMSGLPSGSSINISNASNVQQQFLSNQSGTVSIYVTPQASATWNWKVASYTYLPSTGTFTIGSSTNLYPTQAVSLLSDPGITNTTTIGNSGSTSTYTSLNSPDQIYDYAAYWETLTNGIQMTRVTSGSGSELSFSSGVAVTLSTSASNVYTATASSATIKAASSFTVGATYNTFSTNSTVTLSTGMTYGTTMTCAYISSSGASTVFTLSGLPTNSSVYITNGSNVQQQFNSGVNSGTQVVYVAPGSSTTWNWKVVAYNYIASSGTFSVGSTSNQYPTQTVSLLSDPGITTSNVTTVSGYTSITTADQLYDYIAYWVTQQPSSSGGIGYSSLITKNGKQISFGSNNLVLTSGTHTPPLSFNGTTTFTVYVGTSLGVGTTTFTANTATTPTVTTTGTITFGGSAVTGSAILQSGTSPVITSGYLSLTGLNANSTVYVTNGSSGSGSAATGYGSGGSVVTNPLITSSGTTYSFAIPMNSSTTYSYKIAIYNYTSTGFVNFTPQGTTSNTINLGVDPGITVTSATTVAGYSSLGTLDKLYDYSAYWETQSTGITYNRFTSKSSTTVSLGSVNLTVNSSGSVWTVSGTAPTATALTIDAGSTLAAGTTFSQFNTTGTVTIGSGSSISCLYTVNGSTSYLLQLTGIAAYSTSLGQAYVSITNGANGAGTQQAYVAVNNTTGIYSYGLPPGTTGTYSYKIAQYGNISTGFVNFTPSVGGLNSVTINLSNDNGINNATVSGGVPAIASTTVFTTIDQIYDYSAYWETTNNTGGITVARPVSQSGVQVSLGSNSLTYSSSASPVWAYSGTAITVKGSTLTNGSVWPSLMTTSTVTFTGTTNNAVIYSSGGNSGILTITIPSNLISAGGATVYLQNGSGSQQAYVASKTTTPYVFYTPIGSTGTWTWVVKRPGYTFAIGTFTASVGGQFTGIPSTPQKLNADGTVMYTGTTSSLVTVSFNGTTEADIKIGNGSVNVQTVLDATETSLATNPGMIWLAGGRGECSEFLSANGNFIFLSSGWRFEVATSGNASTVNGFAISSDNITTNTTNGTVTFLTATTAGDVAAAVWNSLVSAYTTSGTMGAQLSLAEAQAALAAALSA